MKKYFIIVVLVLISVLAHAQVDSTYKYSYTFSPTVNAAKPYIIIDSSVNARGLASVSGQIKDDAGRCVMFQRYGYGKTIKKQTTF